MDIRILRAVAVSLALALPTTAGARGQGASVLVEPPVFGPTPPAGDAELAEPSTPPSDPAASAAAVPPPAATPPIEPAPAALPPPEVVDATANRDPEVDRDAIIRAESTRDLGASVLIGGGMVTVTGVILILAGFGATGAAVRKDRCGDTLCADTTHKVLAAAKVTVAGLMISTVGSVTLISGVIAYGVGHRRLTRARGGRFAGLGLSPSSRGAMTGLRGRF